MAFITKPISHRVPPRGSSARLAAEIVFSQPTVSVPQGVSETATTDHQVPPPIIRNLRSDCACRQPRSCRRLSVVLQIFCLSCLGFNGNAWKLAVHVRTYLAHHELESVVVIITMLTIVIAVIAVILSGFGLVQGPMPNRSV